MSIFPLLILWYLDRRERESPYAFAAAFLWGGLIATSIALPINTAAIIAVTEWLEQFPELGDDARTGRRDDGRRAAVGADRRGDHQGHRHRAAVLAAARRVRQRARRLHLRRAGRRRFQLVRVGAVRAAELRRVRHRAVRLPDRRAVRVARPRAATRCSRGCSAPRSASRGRRRSGGCACSRRSAGFLLAILAHAWNNSLPLFFALAAAQVGRSRADRGAGAAARSACGRRWSRPA